MQPKKLVSVIGGHKTSEAVYTLAEEIGAEIARAGAVTVCGGLSGVMEAVCRGAKSQNGLTLGIIPGENKDEANPYCDIIIPTGMGYTRNTLVAGTGDVVIALPGEYGTLSEIGFALISGKPVYGFDAWDIPDIIKLSSPSELQPILSKGP